MAQEPRRFDDLTKVVRDHGRHLNDTAATLLARLAAHTHTDPTVLLSTLLDAKGDLLVATTADTVARLPVGTDDQVLMADSTQTPGIRWATFVRLGGASIATVETTTSATYVDLATPGPALTLDVGPIGGAVVAVTAGIAAGDSEGYASVALTGANTIGALDQNAAQTNIGVTGFVTARFSALSVFSTLTPGSTTFTMKYRRGTGTDPAEFYIRKIGVITF